MTLFAAVAEWMKNVPGRNKTICFLKSKDLGKLGSYADIHILQKSDVIRVLDEQNKEVMSIKAKINNYKVQQCTSQTVLQNFMFERFWNAFQNQNIRTSSS